MIGRVFSHYRVLEEISRGGMGIVYRALDLKLDREVALKILPPELVADPERKRRFVQEAKSAAKLNHPIRNKRKRGSSTEYRYRLWGADATGVCIEVIVAPYPEYGLWRCVIAFPMSSSTQLSYLKRIRK